MAGYTKCKKQGFKAAAGYIGWILTFFAVIAAFSYGITFFSKKADNEGANTLRDGIARASVQCYAIEGRYPPSVDYLEENYGIQIDEKRYNVFYNGFASNIMPEITVNRVEK